jgi:histidine triad (HIT) family protein
MHCLRVILYPTMLVGIIILLSFEQAQSYSVAANVNPLEKKNDDPLLMRLGELAEGLLYTSESDYPLELVSFPTPLTNERLIKFARSTTGTRVKRLDLAEFFPSLTLEGVAGEMFAVLDKQLKDLESFMKQELEDTFVYRIGDEPEIIILAFGTTKDGQRVVGFRTVSIET